MKMQKVLGTVKEIATSNITRSAIAGALDAFAKRPMKSSSSGGSTILVLGIGLVVGSIAALLLTPMSGPDLRGKLMSFVAKAKKEVEAKVEALEGEATTPDGQKPAGTNSHSRRQRPDGTTPA